MKHNLLKSVILSVILLMGVSNAWAATIFNCGIEVNETWYKGTGTINSGNWLGDKTAFNNKDFGVITSLKLGGQYDTWDDNQKDQCSWNGNNGLKITISTESGTQKAEFRLSCYNSGFASNNNTWKTTGTINNCGDKSAFGRYTYDISSYAAGKYKMKATWFSPSGISTDATANFTIPGFTTTSKSQKFDSTPIGENSSKTISFSAHYGTALKTGDCSLSGTNGSEFSVTSITESSVTVQFKPTSTGDKSATLTITDAHSKKCTITLSGTATPPTYTVTFNANGHGTAPDAQTVIQGAKATEPTAPTATGYTFGGWYREAGCTNAFDFNTAINANITLYAKWTIKQYTLYFSADGGTITGTAGGNPITSPATINHGTSVSLTATPSGENAFAQWVNEGDVKLSTETTYTFTLTSDKTVKAIFSKPTTVYLKPSSAWKEHNAHFAIYAWGKTNSWVEMAAVDCEGDYYKANVPAGFSDFAFVRLRPAGADGYSSTNGGHNWDNKWDQTGNLSVQANGKNMYDIDDKTVSYIHLKPNNNWKSAEARFAAYFFNNTGNKWVNLTLNGDVYTCKKPAGYTSVIFCRMKPGTSNGWRDDQCWNKTKDLTILNDGSNCFSINQDDWGCSGSGDGNANGANGEWFRVLDDSQWKTFTTPTYPLTLKATPYGEYTVKCNGVSHTSSRTKDIVIDLPVGATVEITKAESYDAAYNNDLVIKTSSKSSYEAAELNTTYTFCGATTIEENFTTTAAHVVYLRVATDDAEWNTQGDNYIYCTNRLTNEVVTMTPVAAGNNSEINQETGYNYFKATVPADPAGYRAFRFERKTSKNAVATNTTEYFEHLLPLGQSNCFTIKGKNISLGTFYGDWALGTAEGDYRILYVEQQVAHGTDENAWKTVINTTYQHASDIIKKGGGATIVSLHIKYDKTKHPEVILQKFTGGKWVNVEGQAHMVLGPLTASADMAMLPGRRNTEGDVNLRYGDGIEEIKDDAETGIEGRVWNFVVQQSGASAYINFNANDFAPYSDDDDYYIRTDNAAGGWMTYTLPGNVMTHSDYALEHSGYSHYFCKWVESAAGTPNTKFVVANEYGAAISDTIVADKFTNEDGTLNADANVRWMWNEYTNVGSRAYIAGSKENDFLKVFYAEKSKKFEDKGKWVYEIDLTDVQVGDILTSIKALYDGEEQELLEQTHVNAGGLVMLTSTGVARTGHHIRVIYDFKINQTLIYLIPTGADVSTSIDMIIERTNQDEEGEAIQVRSTITPADEGLTVYGVITLTKDHITDPKKSEQQALTYWISFPFDVNIADISGFGEHGKDWILRKYNGAKRAEKGWFLDTPTFWERISEGTLEANTGYVLALHTRMQNESCPLYDNTSTLKLYFPSNKKITDPINTGLTQTTCSIPEHICTIEKPLDRRDADSNWNFIGVPSFANKNNKNSDLNYFYEYNFATDKYSAEKNDGPTTFRSMHAYMVQFGGTIDWSSIAENNAQQLAAKKNASAEDNYELRLELQQNGAKADQTFVELHDDATTMFDMNVDLTKMLNASSANIYTLIGSDNQVAANVMPIANTTIPVGVQIAKAGEYTFAMPDGTDGITVELIDYETNTTTNLLLSEYTVNLGKGTFENRFALHVKPSKVVTGVEDINGETTGDKASVKKYLIDGVLYMQKDGALYDAQGRCVQ